MRRRGWVSGLSWAAMVLIALVPVAGAWAASGKVLYAFQGGNDGAVPTGSLIFDSSGNLFGTASIDGAYRAGTIFELTPARDGHWKEQVIHAFTSGWDGAYPSAGLIADSYGHFYGTTEFGGGGGCGSGCGVVFKLVPGAGGKWKETVLHLFRASRGGFYPEANLVFDVAGNLYGTTTAGGGFYIGTVFKMWPVKGDVWRERVLRSFTEWDGQSYQANLIPDTSGNLYGTTLDGGAYGYGTVFELKRSSNGKWDEVVLHSFQQSDGQSPRGGLIFDSKGALYGTTEAGGARNYGAVFKLLPRSDGTWSETVLYSFAGGTDGAGPQAALIFDPSGNLYGTTLYGGGPGCYGGYGCGTVFKLSPSSGGSWIEALLYALDNIAGNYPVAGLILDSSGNLYGTTEYGGSGTGCGYSQGCGIVFEITP